MLSHLNIDNFAIASHLDMEFHGGMTVITGETGAGKSIMLGALGLALGDRADAAIVRHGADRTDIHATFDISNIPEAQQWLASRELSAGHECMLRRVVTKEGRSRGFINGSPATLNDLKTLGNMLIDIHSQHAHQSLLKKEQQRRLLDEFANTQSLVDDIKNTVADYSQLAQRLATLEANHSEQTARAQLLGYQVEELDQLALAEGELEQLEAEQKQRANAESILQSCHHALALCQEGELNVSNILNQAIRSLANIPAKTKGLEEAEQLLNSALIQAEEASHEIAAHIDNFEVDPERLLYVEQRLNLVFEIARKHRIDASQLSELHQQLQSELNSIAGSDEEIDQLHQQTTELRQRYQQLASKLSKKRRSAAQKLEKQVEAQLKTLAMSNCRFSIELAARQGEEPHPQGLEDIHFLISTNPGQPAQPLARTASGGELSRISLAIQVVTAQTSAIPTMVFDEVDVGIGGATAEVVGNLLQQLGEKGQVLCVTHQPQVASKGHQHLYVSKQSSKKSVTTQLKQLAPEDKIEEIARMLGGIDITEQSIAHAKQMLAVH
ncbi:DNA repair protein RecN [Dasania sp. GY-MA-18]|uniref:DNA repair protein RecN n=1 Tax=Dasania phycosphaerae TaxID=2950436 RepID=A0A9J6RGX2_9GAMM|nr:MULTISPECIES: DNA repair protein RecN [Dasania]MCR8921263.1 DNA repair protein RecN [Dasania sp. GY-MA-18]MCZ0863691.1 DNA repair protein RecN [Dasania phycosphaerae]MCZ0867419.1 DNA repair protein RecN [Dasania phycosphaerae]